MACRTYASSEALKAADSPTLSTHSLPGQGVGRRSSGFFLQLSDEDSLCSSCENLDEAVNRSTNLQLVSMSDSQSLSDLSPTSAPGDSPRYPQGLSKGKKRRAPLPPVHVSLKEPAHSKKQVSQDDFNLGRRLSNIEEDIEKRRRPISSYDAPMINVTSSEASPRLSSSQRFRMKAALMLSLHSPKIHRREDSKKKVHNGFYVGKSMKKKSRNYAPCEDISPEDVSFCFVSEDLHEESEFEVGCDH